MKPEELILGMDIGGTNFRMGLVDNDNNVHDMEVVSSRAISAQQDVPQAICRVIQDYCGRHLDGKLPRFIAAGLPSVLDRERRRVYSATNFPGLDGVDIVHSMTRTLGIPVLIEHDAYYLLAYDMHNSGVGAQGTSLGFYFGTGLGNAIFLNGLPYVGKNGTACEAGHMPAGLSERPCSCGNVGCIEMHCCGKALERIAEEYFPDTPIEALFTRHSDTPVLRDFVRYMAIPVSTEINILDPHAVFIGGGITNMPDFPKDTLHEHILAQTRKPYPAENLQLYFSAAGAENGIIGAAIEGRRKMQATEYSVS